MDTSAEQQNGVEISSFEGWLEEIATHKDTTPEAVLNQLISTFWIVEELDDTLESSAPYSARGNDQKRSPTDQSDARSTNDRRTEHDPDPSPAVDPSFIALMQTLQTKHPETLSQSGMSLETEARIRRIDDRMRNLTESRRNPADAARLDDVRGDIKDLAARQNSLEDVSTELIGAIEDDLRTVYEELRRAVETNHTTAAENAGSLDVLRQNTQQLSVALTEERTHRQAELERLADGLTTSAEDKEALSNTLATVSANCEAVSNRLDEAVLSFQSTIDTVDDHLETFASRFEATRQANEAVVDVLDDHLVSLCQESERSARLGHVLESAQREGVAQATCEECAGRVNLEMLQLPRCPHCETSIGEFDNERHWFRRRPTLRTAEPSPDSRAQAISSQLRTIPSIGEVRGDP